jgi:hypothetical protein
MSSIKKTFPILPLAIATYFAQGSALFTYVCAMLISYPIVLIVNEIWLAYRKKSTAE